jgi:long-chain acyl-CoA synthetase
MPENRLRAHLATLLDDFRRLDREIAVVRYQGIRRRVTTYGEIARLAGRFAALLAQRNIVPGDRVLIWADNSAEWVAAFFGCLMRGVLAVPLDAYGNADFAARVCADVRPALVVGDVLLLRQLPEDWPRLIFEDFAAALPAAEAAPVAGLSHETPLQILFTSGTTGDPKGIVLTHGNVLASIGPIEQGMQSYLRYERPFHPIRVLHTLPLSHVFGQMMGLWVPPMFAGEVHYESRLVAPRIMETIKRERISVLAAVPRVLALLKTHLETTRPTLADRIVAARHFSLWRRYWHFRDIHSALGFKFWAMVSGGGALPDPLEKFWSALCFVVVQGYGMTETTALITLNHPFHVAEGTIGKPLPGREVKLGPDGEVLVRGPMISGATWSGGALEMRKDEWLATGDLAEARPSGDFRFLGRKSEVIVTASGVNLHPEDLEAAIEQEAGVAACAVVPIETASGSEPCAVLAFRGTGAQAAAAIERANTRLAEFQRLSRWVLWPEPDLPRTSTGKVRRKAVSAWLAGVQAAARGNGHASAASFAASSDWLLALIAQITGEAPSGVGDELLLTEDLHLDSLGRVQLAAAIEERMGTPPESGLLERAQTLGELRGLVLAEPEDARDEEPPTRRDQEQLAGASELANSGAAAVRNGNPSESRSRNGAAAPNSSPAQPVPRPEADTRFAPLAPGKYIYPHWPWWLPFRWLRTVFLELVAQPLVWLLANPRVTAPGALAADEPMLIVANHVTAFDGPLLEYALPSKVRRRMSVAMSGEMLEDYRHFRNPEYGPKYGRFYPFGPLAYLLVTALFNVFPLPRQRDFQRSFAHAGEAMDRGFHVMVFPEGTRSAEGTLARFRPGIGLLVKESGAAVLPMAMRGLGELKTRQRGWFRSGSIEVLVGQPIRFAPEETEAAITARLHAEVEALLKDSF